MSLTTLTTRSLIMTASAATLLFASGVASAAAQPLVDAAWVKQHSCDSNVRVLDIRNALDGHSVTDYLRGHIPCAVYSDYLKAGWRTKKDGVVGQLPSMAQLEKLVGGLGIGNDTHVVIVAAGKNALDMGSATRVFWTFKVMGDNNVSILNGGLAAYQKAKYPLQRGNNKPTPVAFTAHFQPDLLATEQQVVQAMNKGEVLVDNRPHNQYIGINRHPKAERSGTIPGAINLPESWLTSNNGGTFRDPATLRKLYGIAKVPTQGAEINFCNTGHWASLGWFVSYELLGDKKARVYDGSMVQWSANKSLPMQVKDKI